VTKLDGRHALGMMITGSAHPTMSAAIAGYDLCGASIRLVYSATVAQGASNVPTCTDALTRVA